MPGEIEGGEDHEEKEPVTHYANNNASPSLIHSGSFRLHIRNVGTGSLPFGRRPFFSN